MPKDLWPPAAYASKTVQPDAPIKSEDRAPRGNPAATTITIAPVRMTEPKGYGHGIA